MTLAFDIFQRGDGPNSFDCAPSRGPLEYVPREGRYTVQQFGGSPTPTGGISAEARADFTRGKIERGPRATRPTAETQIPGSINATPGDNGGEVKRSATK